MKLSDTNIILRDIDEAVLPDGSQRTFSIGFVTKKGHFIFLKRAIKSGTTQHQSMHDFKGVQAVNQHNVPVGHPYPVYIHSIMYYSGTFTISKI